MKEIHYVTEVRRRRGKWHVRVPALPRDAPVVVTEHLGNAAPVLILELAEYLGVNPSIVSVSVEAPKRAGRRRARLTPTYAQALGGLGALGGLYALAGYAVTLIVASVAVTALGVLRESGRI